MADKLSAWLKLRDHYLFTGAIKVLTAVPKFCCSAFLVPKKDGGYRLVVDLRPTNKYFPTMATTYETLNWLKHVPRRIVFGASLDLQDHHHHHHHHHHHMSITLRYKNQSLMADSTRYKHTKEP